MPVGLNVGIHIATWSSMRLVRTGDPCCTKASLYRPTAFSILWPRQCKVSQEISPCTGESGVPRAKGKCSKVLPGKWGDMEEQSRLKRSSFKRNASLPRSFLVHLWCHLIRLLPKRWPNATWQQHRTNTSDLCRGQSGVFAVSAYKTWALA